MTDPQTAADAAERMQAMLDAWREIGDIRLKVAGADLRALLEERARMAAELQQVRGERAAAQPPIVAELMRLTPEQLSARRCAWCSPNPTAAGLWCLCIAACGNPDCKHDAVETDGPAASAAPDATGDTQTGEQRADGKRTPEQWCAEYGIDIADPDGWRNTGDPAWDEPITLPDFLRRAAVSTTRGLTPDVWNRLSREAHEAADAERSDAEGAGKGPESHGDAISSADRPSA